MKVKLIKDWPKPSGGQEKKDAVIELPDAEGKTLCSCGYAEAVVEAGGVDAEVKAAAEELRTSIRAEVNDAVKAAVKGLAIREGIRITAGADPLDAPGNGFPTLGHFAKSVRTWHAEKKETEELRRYREFCAKAPTGMGEYGGPEGGILIPTTIGAGIWKRTTRASDILSRILLIPIGGNTYTINQEKGNSEADGTLFAGVRAFWRGEAVQMTASKPQFVPATLRLKELYVLTYVTNEQLEDTPFSLGAYLEALAPRAMAWKIGKSLIQGNGVQEPQGALNAPCKVTVAKETDQAAATVKTQNISKMWSRCYADCRESAIWHINQNVEPQLDLLSVGLGTSGQLTYMQPGGISGKPYGTLKAREIKVTPWNKTLGTEGDIMLVDWSQFLGIVKGSGAVSPDGVPGSIETAQSPHLRFDYNESVFRFIWRMDGQFMWPAALTPAEGTDTLSPVVSLAVRA